MLTTQLGYADPKIRASDPFWRDCVFSWCKKQALNSRDCLLFVIVGHKITTGLRGMAATRVRRGDSAISGILLGSNW